MSKAVKLRENFHRKIKNTFASKPKSSNKLILTSKCNLHSDCDLSDKSDSDWESDCHSSSENKSNCSSAESDCDCRHRIGITGATGNTGPRLPRVQSPGS